MTPLERAARAAAECNIRTEADPCRLRTWLAALFEPDFPDANERATAEEFADMAVDKIARAVLDALREPTPEMIKAICLAAYEPGPDGFAIDEYDAREVWQAAIDAAMKAEGS